jgi:hypothetical protein
VLPPDLFSNVLDMKKCENFSKLEIDFSIEALQINKKNGSD